MSLIGSSSTRSILPDGMPEPDGFEVVLSRKIGASTSSLFHIFKSLDRDDDGHLSKTDLQDNLSTLFGVNLDAKQVDSIFEKVSLLGNNPSGSDEESKTDQHYSHDHGKDLITFKKFQMYILYAQSGSLYPPSQMFASNMTKNAPLKIERASSDDKKSIAARRKKLRSTVLKAIRQGHQSDNFGMAASSLFLQIDTRRNSLVSHNEFRSWLADKQGIQLSENELKLVLGAWVKDEGLTLKEFTYFVDCLLSECGNNGCSCERHDENELSLNQRANTDRITTTDNHDEKSDKELIWALLNHFREMGKSYSQAFAMLNVQGNRRLTPSEISMGIKGAGLNVTSKRSRDLLRRFSGLDGGIDIAGFVRMMTSEPIPDVLPIQ